MKTHAQLLSNINLKGLTYADLLTTKEWFDKRSVIIRRDNHKCTICGTEPTMYVPPLGNIWLRKDHRRDIGWLDGKEMEFSWAEYFHEVACRPYILHVHHKCYIFNRFPWEYPDEDLTTLCNWCHSKVHREQDIPVYLDATRSKVLHSVLAKDVTEQDISISTGMSKLAYASNVWVWE